MSSKIESSQIAINEYSKNIGKSKDIMEHYIGVLADEEWAHWKDGSLTHVAQLVGGRWLGGWVLASSALSNWGLFSSELLEDSFQLLGMAEAGLAPRFFAARHPRLGTPLLAILFQLVILSTLIGFDFESIM